MQQIRRLGPLQYLLGMIPGMGKELRGVKVDEREFDRIQAIILSMTPQERRHPELIKGSRRLRIAKGSGTNVQAVKALIKQFEQMRKVMRQVAQGRMPDLGALMRQSYSLTSTAHGSQTSTNTRRWTQEPDLAGCRRRSAIQARRSRDRDRRALQRTDRPVDDRAR